MSNVKVFKKGEVIFKEGDKLTNLFFLQKGGINICLQKNRKITDITQIGPNHVFGEQALAGTGSTNVTALATNECHVMELPVESFKSIVEASNPFIKMVVKSLTERIRTSLNEVRTSKNEKDGTPCSDDLVAQLFGAVFHTLNHKGQKDPKKPNSALIAWGLCKQYSQRIFGVSPRKLEQALLLLVKLKMANLTMGKPPENPDGPDEILEVEVTDLAGVENFFEFWQYFYFKNGRTDLLRYDESVAPLLGSLIKMSETLTLDRFGAVSTELTNAIEFVKNDLGIDLKNTHFERLEQKGVMSKRQPRQDGTVFLSFEPKEYVSFSRAWKIINEIDKWNEKGFVDPTEEPPKPKKKPGESSCPQCAAGVPQAAKFCQECGFKLVEKAG